MTTFDLLGGVVCTVRRRTSQLRRAWRIAANHTFKRRRTHKIMSLKVVFHMFVKNFGYLFGHKSHTDTRVREVVVRQRKCGIPVRT
jgi:hypothetical protein